MRSHTEIDVSRTGSGRPVIADDASVHSSATIGAGSRVWNLSQIREQASVGEECVIGRNVYVDHGVVIGDRCKIQNGAQLFGPAELGGGVFVGPGAMLTNDIYPRAVTPDGQLKTLDDWNPTGVVVEQGASIGAGAVIIGGLTIGAWSVVAAGAVVTHDVPPYALVVGTPARRIGWVGRSGRPLTPEGDQWTDGIDRYVVSEHSVELAQ